MAKNKLVLPAFYSVTPAFVRYCRELSFFERFLYSEITALCNYKGYCYATNSYFETVFSVSDRTVQNGIKHLVDQGFISSDVVLDPDTKQVMERQIRLAPPPEKNFTTPPEKKFGVTRDNAFYSKNNTRVNNLVNPGFKSFSKSKKPDIEIEWLDDYYNSIQ